jgi:hypothetical protein
MEICVQKDICGFETSMNESMEVEILHSRSNPEGNDRRPRLAPNHRSQPAVAIGEKIHEIVRHSLGDDTESVIDELR